WFTSDWRTVEDCYSVISCEGKTGNKCSSRQERLTWKDSCVHEVNTTVRRCSSISHHDYSTTLVREGSSSRWNFRLLGGVDSEEITDYECDTVDDFVSTVSGSTTSNCIGNHPQTAVSSRARISEEGNLSGRNRERHRSNCSKRISLYWSSEVEDHITSSQCNTDRSSSTLEPNVQSVTCLKVSSSNRYRCETICTILVVNEYEFSFNEVFVVVPGRSSRYNQLLGGVV